MKMEGLQKEKEWVNGRKERTEDGRV